MNKLHKFLFLVCSVTAATVNATTIALSENAGTVEVYLSSGTQISTTYTSPLTSSVVGNNIAMRFGTFTGGFTPTVDNSSSWFSNFVGVNGYITVLNAASNAGRLSASIGGGDSNTISSPVTSNSGVGVNGSASIAKDAALYAIIWNAPYVANGSGGNTFYPTNPGLQAAILTNASWIMPLSSGTDPTTIPYSLSAGTSALVGALDLANKGVTLAVIPEPNTLVLFGVGLLSLIASRRTSYRLK